MILAKSLIEADLKKWREMLLPPRGTQPGEPKPVPKVTVSEVANTVRQMLAEKEKTTLPIESLLVYPFPQRTDGDEHTGLTSISCELTIGEEVFMASEEIPRRLGSPETSDYFSIKPGDFAVLITFEYIYIPTRKMGFISIRNSYKQRGLINVSGFHVDPGFHGRLIFTVYNGGPSDIVLKFRERLFMLAFAEVSGTADLYQFGDTKAQEFRNGKDILSIPTQILGPLSGRSVSPRTLDQRLRKLETIVNVLLIPLAAALIIAIISILIDRSPAG